MQSFREALRFHGIDVAIISNYRHVYYLSGHLRETEFPQILVVQSSGASALVTDLQPTQVAVDETFVYATFSIERPWDYSSNVTRACEALSSAIGAVAGHVRRVALEKDRICGTLLDHINARWPHASYEEAARYLKVMRRRKYTDESALIANGVRAIEAGYASGRQFVIPGNTELDVFKQIHGEIVRYAGYHLKIDGDFASGVRVLTETGTPVQREIRPGDLYIIDVYPCFYGYHADLCRTFAASVPTELQLRAWSVIRDGLALAEECIRPGVPVRDVYSLLRNHIDSHDFVRGTFTHHAGHGIGLEAQEAPWIIPGSNEVFEVGDMIAIEPGCYGESLQGGVRLECNYVVHEDGLENLSHYPLGL